MAATVTGLGAGTLDAVIEVLESLRQQKYGAAMACSMEATGNSYDQGAHSDAVSEHAGVCAALNAVYRMENMTAAAIAIRGVK